MRKKIHIIFILLAIMSFTLHSQTDTVASHVKRANEMYKQGKYSDAAKLYEEMLKRGGSAELYYNLGNSYYKIDEIGLAILNYERALRLNPRFKDASYNLRIAESKVVDNINSTPTFFVKRWVHGLISNVSSNHWAVISFFFFTFTLGAFLFFLFAPTRNQRKISFYTTIFTAALFIATFVFSGVRKEQFVKHNSAVVLSGSVSAKSSPDVSGTDLFQLHEGTRVNVKSTLGSWTEISLDNGAVGWVEEKTIARI